ncbi:GNAT family N-acetyltransferase [Actinoplanes sp. NBRC 101535]|uniref:GNAT family N-acetyltransferase n=1 Tax=Actinoplanes sp. NBRC 101535 TaxID=3032196 RepID=UPI00249FC41D|nr:GNAT family N-acetyltransferase [Actinoplanes sp. NBRC 101535]GLY00522.1 hypothetical protein Acsp01_09010 [Actinoplanes sp. NBRC 101535]
MTLVLRPITGPDELDLFNSLPYLLNTEVADDLTAGRRHPHWLWVALRDGRVVARAGWWSRAHDPAPALLDIFDVADSAPAAPGGTAHSGTAHSGTAHSGTAHSGSPHPDTAHHGSAAAATRSGPASDPTRSGSGADAGRFDQAADALELLRVATAEVVPAETTPPQHTRYLPPDWRNHERHRRPMEILEQAGAKVFVERLRLEWLPQSPVPVASDRLTFRPPRDADELIGLMTQVLDGTLDTHSRDELRRMSAHESATGQYHSELERYATPHDWWRIGVLPSGEPVGFVIPAHNGYNPLIAYIGVVPAHRGKGYVADLLATGTALLAAENMPRVRAATDVGNTPMAAAFARAGFRVFERQIDMTW